MAVAITRVTGADGVMGNKRRTVRDLVFSGNYATGGEALTAANLGLTRVETVTFHGQAKSTDAATSTNVTYDYTNSKVLHYESGASGAAEAEKTDAEAYPTGSNVRVTAIGR
jgi:hypothetical protein